MELLIATGIVTFVAAVLAMIVVVVPYPEDLEPDRPEPVRTIPDR